MRIRIRAGNPDLESRGFRGRGGRRDEADRRGAVLEAPGDGDWSPEVFDETLVAVYCGGEEGHDVWEAVEEAGEEVPAEVREVREVGPARGTVGRAAVEEVGIAGGGKEGDVHVAAVAGEAFAGFGHEAGGYAVFGANGFDDVSVGRGME